MLVGEVIQIQNVPGRFRVTEVQDDGSISAQRVADSGESNVVKIVKEAMAKHDQIEEDCA